MADILIRGMEMPKDENGFIKLMIFNDGRCFVAVGENEVTSKTGIVTARELPEGHGRLIDADAFKEMCLAATKEAKPDFIRHEDWLKASAITISFCRDIDEQPTIVPAEGGGEDG